MVGAASEVWSVGYEVLAANEGLVDCEVQVQACRHMQQPVPPRVHGGADDTLEGTGGDDEDAYQGKAGVDAAGRTGATVVACDNPVDDQTSYSLTLKLPQVYQLA